MRRSVTLLLASAAFIAAPAFAQLPPEQQDKPVEQTQAPENEVLDAEAKPVALPIPGSGTPAPAAQQAVAPSAARDTSKWNVENPPYGTIRQVAIRTDQGSWMDVDVSPDGRRIAFTLLGDIYTMPISGGTPTRISAGFAWEVHPRWSPDGSRIAFTSDRGGGDNIWIMNADGSDKRALTSEKFRLMNQPSWSPDGRYIVAKKHFTTGRSLGTGEIWLYHVSGGGGVQLVKRSSEAFQKELGEPIFAPDGKRIYFTKNVTPGNTFIYAQDSNGNLFDILEYDIDTGKTETAVSGLGGAVRPTPSPDGKMIAFVRREQTRSKLYVKDLVSGEERKIYDDLDQDVQETWAVTGVYPNMDWTPDSKSVVFWAGGHINRVDADGSNARVIPFAINDTRGVIDAPHPVIEVAPDSFTTAIPRFAAVSPDGRQVVFETLGKLYVKSLGGGTAKRLTNDNDGLEMYPAWSRDGQSLAFVRWTDAGLGRIVVTGPNGGKTRTITSQPGHYARPQFSPDGKTIVFEKREGGYLTSPRWSEDPGVYRVAAAGGTPVLVAKGTAKPQFGATSDRVFMVASDDGKQQLISTDLSGEARRVHAAGELASDFIVSPDGEFVAFKQNYEAYVMPILPGSQSVDASIGGNALPTTRASKGGADFITWSMDGQRLNWTMGPTLYTVDRAAMFQLAPPQGDAPKDAPPAFTPPTRGVALAMTERADKPSGTYALTGARIVTMAGYDQQAKDGGIIDDGVIVVTGDRIVAVGRRGEVQVPSGAKTIDVSGKTIIPGLVDAHAHGSQGEDGMVPQQNWSLIQNLALGTTTIHDPSAGSDEIFHAAEMQRAGKLLAPRIFSTGEIVYGAKAPGVYAEINSYDDALAHVRRLKAQGGRSIKNYNQPRREQRQMVVAASIAENMLVVAEGGSLYGMDMTLVADGNSTLEHNVPLDIYYDDMIQFFGQSTTNNTPTLVVTYGGLAGDPYWRQATDVWKNPLLIHTPPAILRAATVRRTKAPEEDFVDDDSAREVHKLANAGVAIAIGAHGQQAGIGPHWELWSFVRGGYTPVEALAAGTIVSARSLGMDRDIGSIEAGKLADLVVLDADPTADIRNSDKVARVMIGGRMYDARTMNEVDTGNAKRLPYYWEGTSDAGRSSLATGHGHGD